MNIQVNKQEGWQPITTLLLLFISLFIIKKSWKSYCSLIWDMFMHYLHCIMECNPQSVYHKSHNIYFLVLNF